MTMNWLTTLLLVLGAADLALAPILFTLWWGDRISH